MIYVILSALAPVLPEGVKSLAEQSGMLINFYIVINVALLFLSGYLFVRLSPDIMKVVELMHFRVLVIVFQVYVILETLQTLNEFGLVSFPTGVYTAICFLSLFCAVANAFCFCATMMLRLNLGYSMNLRYSVLMLLPLAATLVVLIISLFNGAIFSVSEDGHIDRGPLYSLLLVFGLIYLIAVGYMSIKKARRAVGSIDKRGSASTVFFVLLLIAWLLVDDLFFYGTTVLPIAIFTIILHLFIYFQQSGIYTDMLTGMNNRRKAEAYLGAELDNNSASTPLYMFMGDINGFKQINDLYGHTEGDAALMIFAEAVKKSASAYNGFAARYGGDEFVWAWRPVKGGDFDPEMVINDIRHRVAAECVATHKPYVISLSVGYIICEDANKSISHYLKEADRKMYADKQAHYRVVNK